MSRNMSSIMYSTLWITFFVLCMSPSGESLKCYVCNSVWDANCIDISESGDTYLRECGSLNQTEEESSKYTHCGNYTNCRKQSYTVEELEFELKEDRVVRSCGCERHPKYDCFYSSTVNLKSTTCECEEDKCNAGQNLSFGVTMLTSLVMFALLLMT